MTSATLRAVRGFVLVSVVTLSACGSNTPTAPTSTNTPAPPVPAPMAPASIVGPTGTGLSQPGCDAGKRMSDIMGLPQTLCPFVGTLLNRGTGCAANVRGTITIYDQAHAFVSSAGWSYPYPVRPNEQLSYQGTVN